VSGGVRADYIRAFPARAAGLYDRTRTKELMAIWGVTGDASDNPRKDVDNTGNFGPENIFYANPEAGTYTVMVEHWGSGTADADGQVTINLIGEAPRVVDITDLASHHVFNAGKITWPSKAVTLSGAHHDCSANWSGGCRDAIP
jgi:hypothetical protein